MRLVRHGLQGPCSLGALNMKAGIQYSYSLPTLYDCCPMSNAISDSSYACNRKKHITGACDIKMNGMASYSRPTRKEHGIKHMTMIA